ncbi:MAG: DUF2490 domain-containing protein [Prolixibacteraceae bacterium]|nr:DUF2490 domain-containing protein [Prolixibacteraceae bacterium]MBN2774168.1 DUF2490 domain-containing protein [Prolixibacteraceae bacterium]
MKKTSKSYHISKIRIVIFLVIIVVPSFGQQKDFGLWTGFEVEKKLSKRFDLDAEIGYRLKNNLTQRDESFAGISISYSKKRLKAGAGYRLTNEYNAKRTYDIAHRMVAQVGYSPKINRFTLDYRFRFQAQYNAVNSTPEGHIPVTYIRNRLKLSYNVKGIPLEPSLSYELFTKFNNYQKEDNEKTRLDFSISYKLFKNNEIEVSLLRIGSFGVDDMAKQMILSIGYKLAI